MTEISLMQVHQAIKTALSERFPKITVADYLPEAKLSMLAPALLLELESFPLGADLGDGRYPAHCHFTIHCVLGWEVDNLALELWEFAAAVAQLIYQQGVWLRGGVISRPTEIEVYPGNFKKDSKRGYDSRVISWQQTLYLGRSLWQGEGITPQTVFLGYAPGGEAPPIDEFVEVKGAEQPEIGDH